jgi:hypothetical protein
MSVKNVLAPGDRFPEVRIDVLEGPALEVPRNLNSPWSVLLVYRGHW